MYFKLYEICFLGFIVGNFECNETLPRYWQRDQVNSSTAIVTMPVGYAPLRLILLCLSVWTLNLNLSLSTFYDTSFELYLLRSLGETTWALGCVVWCSLSIDI